MMEPVFVARDGAEAEDDGWVMSYVYDRERNLSEVVILDARDFTGDPVAAFICRRACRSASTAAGVPMLSPPRPILSQRVLPAGS
jgi:YD repeat-containing protein